VGELSGHAMFCFLIHSRVAVLLELVHGAGEGARVEGLEDAVKLHHFHRDVYFAQSQHHGPQNLRVRLGRKDRSDVNHALHGFEDKVHHDVARIQIVGAVVAVKRPNEEQKPPPRQTAENRQHHYKQVKHRDARHPAAGAKKLFGIRQVFAGGCLYRILLVLRGGDSLHRGVVQAGFAHFNRLRHDDVIFSPRHANLDGVTSLHPLGHLNHYLEHA